MQSSCQHRLLLAKAALPSWVFLLLATMQVKEQLLDPETRRRLESIQQYIRATDTTLKPANGTPYPLPPKVPEDKGDILDAWAPKQSDVIQV